MTTKLTLYNGALRMLGEVKLSVLTENRAARRHLDDAWDDGFVDYCLEQGLWNFAIRTIQLTYSPSITPAFGYSYAFEKPDDFIRTAALCSDERFNTPLLDYRDESGYWLADLDALYVRYVSNDTEFGNDYSLWPQTFVKFVEAELASRVAIDITKDREKLADCLTQRKRLLTDAKAKDAMAEPTRFPPSGSWARARHAGTSGQRSRWNGSSV